MVNVLSTAWSCGVLIIYNEKGGETLPTNYFRQNHTAH